MLQFGNRYHPRVLIPRPPAHPPPQHLQAAKQEAKQQELEQQLEGLGFEQQELEQQELQQEPKQEQFEVKESKLPSVINSDGEPDVFECSTNSYRTTVVGSDVDLGLPADQQDPVHVEMQAESASSKTTNLGFWALSLGRKVYLHFRV